MKEERESIQNKCGTFYILGIDRGIYEYLNIKQKLTEMVT